MPNSKSASKRLKQNETRRLINRSTMSSVKTQIKKVVKAADAGDIESAETEYRAAAKKLDQSAAKGIIHANKAARQKSRLQNRIKKAKSA